MDLNQDQLTKLQSFGIIPHSDKSPFIPLLSLSGITLLSFGGLILFKNQINRDSPPKADIIPAPTTQPSQTPKSIQHYLLASQQYFSRALQLQSSITSPEPSGEGGPSQSEIIDLLNQSLLAATDAIKNFPSDYRGFYQRGRVYQSLIESHSASPEPSGEGGTSNPFLSQAIADITHASTLNPDSAEITRELAVLFAKKGDANNTLVYLAKTVSLEPTRAQNFYDLARLQQQTGLITQAVETYNRLLPLVTDPSQRQIVESEKSSLENLLSQNASSLPSSLISPTIYHLPSTISPDSPLIQANANSGLIIAAPETSKDISVSSFTSSNSLSGTATLPANQSSLTLENSNLTTTSQIYLSITKGGKNQILRLLSKNLPSTIYDLPSSFTVGLDSPVNENIEFKWWIVNN